MKPNAPSSPFRSLPPGIFFLAVLVLAAALPAQSTSFAQSSGYSPAQAALAKPAGHGSFMRDPSYRDAYETCEAFLRQAMAIPGADKASLAGIAARRANTPETAGDWTARFRSVTSELAARLNELVPVDPEAPLQGYYVYLGPSAGYDFEFGGALTLAKVGAGPAYGVWVNTAFSHFTCEIDRAPMTPQGGRMVLPPDQYDEPGAKPIELTFNGTDVVLGPDDSAVRYWCGAGATAEGTYRRAQ
jgi:hypothetical protein